MPAHAVLAHEQAEVDGFAPGGVAVDRYQCRVVNQGQVIGGSDGAVDDPLASDPVHEERGPVAWPRHPGSGQVHTAGLGGACTAEVHLAGVLVDPQRADGPPRPRGVQSRTPGAQVASSTIRAYTRDAASRRSLLGNRGYPTGPFATGGPDACRASQ